MSVIVGEARGGVVPDELLSAAGRANPPASGVAIASDAPAFEQISPSLGDKATDELPAWASYRAFRDAARSLKAAEDTLVAARQAYAEAVKALSEEAVK